MSINRVRPSNVRSNDYNRSAVFDRYRTLIEDLVLYVPGLLDCLRILALENSDIKAVKGMLKLTPGKYV